MELALYAPGDGLLLGRRAQIRRRRRLCHRARNLVGVQPDARDASRADHGARARRRSSRSAPGRGGWPPTCCLNSNSAARCPSATPSSTSPANCASASARRIAERAPHLLDRVDWLDRAARTLRRPGAGQRTARRDAGAAGGWGDAAIFERGVAVRPDAGVLLA